jgi:branched-subunit amino acid ABC-type transport system permease component
MHGQANHRYAPAKARHEGPVRWVYANDRSAVTRQESSVRVRLTAIAAVLLGAVFAMLAMTGPASATVGTCGKAEPRDDDTIHVIGCMADTSQQPATPVEGVKISVENADGEVLGEDTSDANGRFDILLGDTFDVLTNKFVVKIDEDSLPDGKDLRNPDQLELEVSTNLESDISITFPIGEVAGATGKGTQALQLLVGGLVFSLLLAMASLGLSMIFGTTGLTNFAHGELITFGALVAFAIDQLPGDISIGGADATVVIGVIAAFVVSGVFGWAQDYLLWGPLRKRGTGLIAMMIISIGLSIFLRNVYQYFAGGDTKNYSQFSSPEPYEIGPILITLKDLIVIALSTTVIVIACVALQRTRTGKAMRAVADNPALSASSGINVERVISIVWIGGAALAGLSGVLLGLTQGFDYQIGFKILLLVFAAVTLGGLGTIYGALFGSFIIGILIEESTLFIAAELKFVGALVVLIAVLLVRPQGLLGRAERVG